MLKNNILENIRKIKEQQKNELIPFEIHGELNVYAWRDGKLFYHDGGDNTITVWAKHAMMHLLTGDVFTNLGTAGKNMPDFSSNSVHSMNDKKNIDGYILSQAQYWWQGSDWEGQWSYCNDAYGNKTYATFPTKMLFGTGKEYANWNHVVNVATQEEQDYLATIWTNQSDFNNNISDSENYYSGTVSAGGGYQKYGDFPLIKTRTVNDYLSAKIDGSPDQTEYGVDGAIKNGKLTFLNSDLLVSGSTDTLKTTYRGIGRPAFLYSRRNTTWNESTAEVFLSSEGLGYENKITYTVTMPEQSVATNTDGWFYPYNGYTLKEVGLFSDSLLSIGGLSTPGVYAYDNMPGGIMIAKRYIAPLRKEANVAISAQWTLYL